MQVIEFRRAPHERYKIKVFPTSRDAEELLRLLRKHKFEIVTHSTCVESVKLRGRPVA